MGILTVISNSKQWYGVGGMNLDKRKKLETPVQSPANSFPISSPLPADSPS